MRGEVKQVERINADANDFVRVKCEDGSWFQFITPAGTGEVLTLGSIIEASFVLVDEATEIDLNTDLPPEATK